METQPAPRTNGIAPSPATALAPREEHTALGFAPRSIDEIYKFSEKLAQSSLIPKALQGKPADVAIVLMQGLELGISPMLALSGIYVVDGKPSTGSELAVGLILRSGKAEFFDLIESTDKVATYKTKRVGSTREQSITFTIQDGERAGLLFKDNWKKYPAAMLRARAAFALGRVVYPDVLKGLIGDDEADEVRQPRDVTPQRPEPQPPKAKKGAKGETAPAEVTVTAKAVEEVPASEATGELQFSEAATAQLELIAKAHDDAGLDEAAKSLSKAIADRTIPENEAKTLFRTLLASCSTKLQSDHAAHFVVVFHKTAGVLGEDALREMHASYVKRNEQIKAAEQKPAGA